MVPGAGRGEETTHKFSAAGRSEVADRGFTVQGAADFVTEVYIRLEIVNIENKTFWF